MNKDIRLCIDDDDKVKYYNLTRQGVLRGKNRDKFIFVMSYGYHNNVFMPLENKDTGGYWRFDESYPGDKAFIFAVALKYKGQLSVDNEEKIKEIVDIAEKFAHGGIQLLYQEFFNTQSFSYWNKMERDLYDLYETLKT